MFQLKHVPFSTKKTQKFYAFSAFEWLYFWRFLKYMTEVKFDNSWVRKYYCSVHISKIFRETWKYLTFYLLALILIFRNNGTHSGNFKFKKGKKMKVTVQSNIILESANRELPTVAVAVHLQTEPLAFLCIGAKVVLVDIFNSGSKFLFLHLIFFMPWMKLEFIKQEISFASMIFKNVTTTYLEL